MSFIIKGKAAPNCCASCNRDLAAIADCVYTKRLVMPEEHDMRSGRHPHCPLVEIPAHGRLIDADALSCCGKECYGCPYESCMLPDIVEDAPTIIPAEDTP